MTKNYKKNKIASNGIKLSRLLVLLVFTLLFISLFSLTVSSPMPVLAQGIDCANAPANTPGCQSTSFFCNLASNPKFPDLLNYATCVITKSVIPLIFALAVVSFVWGVVQYVINAEDGEKKAKGRDFMIYGIIALAVMVSVWGLVRIIGTTFGIEYAIPQVKSNR